VRGCTWLPPQSLRDAVVVVEAGAGAGDESPPNRKRKIRYDLLPLTTELKLFPCIFFLFFFFFFKKEAHRFH
jgi:hypothetical protein